jgi:uncharacterized protein YjbI with pentapeptide repeats
MAASLPTVSAAIIAAGAAICVGALNLLGQNRVLKQQKDQHELQLEQLERQLNIAREGQLTERFTRAVEQLGHDQPSVRLGGVYSLERIARHSEEDRATIIDVLNAHARAYGGGKARAEERVKADVEGAVIVIARRIRHEDDDFFPVLNGIGLSQARLRGLHLENSRLRATNLREALLDGAFLTNARLKDADLSGAHLYGTHLMGAEFERTLLTGAKYDERTEWPDGFDAKAAGALKR